MRWDLLTLKFQTNLEIGGSENRHIGDVAIAGTGQQAIARGAMTEAVAQLRKGLDLLSSVLDGVARHELELDITLGQALMAAKGLAALG